eukprot:5326793-Pyramimonas_sp.AAC.1
MSLTLANIKHIIASIGAAACGEQRQIDNYSGLAVQIQDRQAKEEFPIVRPADLEDSEDQSMASQCLGLLEKMDAVKLR